MPRCTPSAAPSRARAAAPSALVLRRVSTSLPALILLVAACAPARLAGPAPSTPRDEYERRLPRPASEGAREAREWVAAGERALAQAARVRAPYSEALHFARGRGSAVAYRLEAASGDRLRVEAEPPFLRRGGVFLELFLITGAASGRPLRVAQAERGAHALEVHVERGGDYVVRIQPELGHEGLYRIRIRDGTRAAATAALTFPVAGRDARAIRSGYGAPRDGGRRRHRGVDIFAPRGTPVLAAADGVVSEVEVTPLGGRIIWLEAERGDIAFYYAHLDEQLVGPGARVRAGDAIGRVGNTGNARSASPHLHFGVYRGRRSPIDPTPFLRPDPSAAPAAEPIAGDIGALGDSARAAAAALPVHAGPAADAPLLATLPAGSLVRLLGATGSWYRVELPAGGIGFVPAAQVEVSR